MINIIGLSAQLQNGKDTVAELIQELTGTINITDQYPVSLTDKSQQVITKHSPWRVDRFAKKLKQIVAILVGCEPSDLESEAFKNTYLGKEWINTNSIISEYDITKPPTIRQILQWVGTEAMRKVIHDDIWINATLGSLKSDDKVIIADTRFPNECYAIQRKGGIVVRIIRPGKVSTSTHISEIALNDFQDWDYIIMNDGTIDDLRVKVRTMLEHFNII